METVGDIRPPRRSHATLGTVRRVNWRDLAVAVVVASTVAGCTQTVSGAAQRDPSRVDEEGRGYGYGDDRCGLLSDITVQEIVGAEDLVRSYVGPVCQYVMSMQSSIVDVTYSWFETGSLARERAVAEQNGAQLTELVIERHQAFVARRSVTGNACAATADTNPGVASWWVQIRPDGEAAVGADACQDAQDLLAKTLSSDL